MVIRLGKFPTLVLFLALLSITAFAQQPLPMPTQQRPPLPTIDWNYRPFEELRATLNAPLPTLQPFQPTSPHVGIVTVIDGGLVFALILGVSLNLLLVIISAAVGFETMFKFIVWVASFILLVCGIFVLAVAVVLLVGGIAAFMQTSSRDELVKAAAGVVAISSLTSAGMAFASSVVMLLLGAGGFLGLSAYNRIEDTNEDVSRLSIAIRQRSQQRQHVAPPVSPQTPNLPLPPVM